MGAKTNARKSGEIDTQTRRKTALPVNRNLQEPMFD